MKVMIAQFQQETNSFSPVRCDMEMFLNGHFLEGEHLLHALTGTRTEMNGFIQALTEAGAAIIPAVAAHSVSSGPVTQDVFDRIFGCIERALRVQGPVDGILICFHGAMLLEPNLDATGLFLARVREAVGEGTVIGGSLDLHTNLTEQMVAAADVLVGYHTYPHIDLFETGYKTAQLLIRMIKGEIRPVSAWVKIPVIASGEKAQTTQGPAKWLMDRAIGAEMQEGMLSVSLFHMQPWLDVAEAGCAVLAVTDANQLMAEEVAKSLALDYWSIREQLLVELTPLEEAVKQAIALPRGPVVLADSADGTGSGSPGDSTAILQELLSRETTIRAYLTVVDPVTVQQAIEVGVGCYGDFDIGGKIDSRFHTPVKTRAMVKSLHEGTFTFKGPQFTGMEHRMGRTAVLQIHHIFVVVMEKSAFNWDPELYRSVGLEPRDAKLVVVKSPTAFRVNYEEMAAEIYVVDTPGVSSANLLRMPFTQLPEPLFPFQREFDFQPTVKVCRQLISGKSVKPGGEANE